MCRLNLQPLECLFELHHVRFAKAPRSKVTQSQDLTHIINDRLFLVERRVSNIKVKQRFPDLRVAYGLMVSGPQLKTGTKGSAFVTWIWEKGVSADTSNTDEPTQKVWLFPFKITARSNPRKTTGVPVHKDNFSQNGLSLSKKILDCPYNIKKKYVLRENRTRDLCFIGRWLNISAILKKSEDLFFCSYPIESTKTP